MEQLDQTDERPLFSFDMDGVICRPPLGINFTIRRNFHTRVMPETARERKSLEDMRRSHRLLALGLEALRFAGRRPMPDAKAGLEAVAELAAPVLVTGRSFYGKHQIDKWLRHHGLRDYFTELLPNSTHFGNAQYKLWIARQRSILFHVDDDPATTEYLARHQLQAVFLRDWPLNRGLKYPANVIVIRRLDELATHLHRM